MGFGFGLGLGLGFGVVRFARVVVGGAGRDTAGWDAAGGTGVTATGAVRSGAGAGAVRVAVSSETGGSGLGVALVLGCAGASVLLDVVVDVFAAGAFTLRVDWVGGGASGAGSGAPPAPRAAPVDVSAARTAHALRAARECRCRRDDVLGANSPLPSSRTVRRVACLVNACRGSGGRRCPGDHPTTWSLARVLLLLHPSLHREGHRSGALIGPRALAADLQVQRA